MRTRLLKMFVGVVCVAGLGACSAMKSTEAPAPAVTTTSDSSAGNGKIQQTNTVTVTATVESIDLAKRLVTLRGPDGQADTIHVSDAVRNLQQVKKGDQVVATYYESVEVEVKKAGEAQPGVATAGQVERAQPGQKPSATGVQAVTVTATITAIDRKTQMVTLKGPEGRSVRVHVKDASHLEKVKPGDLVEITYTEALAIAVEKPSQY